MLIDVTNGIGLCKVVCVRIGHIFCLRVAASYPYCDFHAREWSASGSERVGAPAAPASVALG